MEQFQILTQRAIYNLHQAINYAENNELTNSQEFLDFLDTINGLSVTY